MLAILSLCFTWIHGHLSFSAAVQALTRPFLLRRAKYGYHFCKPKRARWVEEAVICWLEIIPPSMPSGPEHSGKRKEEKQMTLSKLANSASKLHLIFQIHHKIAGVRLLSFSAIWCFIPLFYPQEKLQIVIFSKPLQPTIKNYCFSNLCPYVSIT